MRGRRHVTGAVSGALVTVLLTLGSSAVVTADRAATPPPAAGATTTSSITFVDSSRPTPCTGAPDRTLPVTVVTPGTPGPAPVVLVAPGSGASQRAVARDDAAALAARGYVGVALDFPCTNAPGYSTTDPSVALDIYHQPGDVSFVLTNLLALNSTPSDALFGLLDPQRIGLVGTSSGAVTAILLFNTCCTDARIRAIESVKGIPVPTSPGLPETGDYDWSRPIAAFFWNGCQDIVTPQAYAAEAYARLGPPKAFVSDPHGTHATDPTFPAGTQDAFLDRFVAGDVSAATAAPFLAARADPSFAFDLGPGLTSVTPSPSCPAAPVEPVPAEATPSASAPTFTG